MPEFFYTLGDHEGTLQIKYDDMSIETELISNRFGETLGTLRFEEKSFLIISLGLTSHWDYKPTNAIHADSPCVYSSEKLLYLSTKDKIHLKCDVFVGSVVNGIQEPLLISLVLNKPPK